MSGGCEVGGRGGHKRRGGCDISTPDSPGSPTRWAGLPVQQTVAGPAQREDLAGQPPQGVAPRPYSSCLGELVLHTHTHNRNNNNNGNSSNTDSAIATNSSDGFGSVECGVDEEQVKTAVVAMHLHCLHQGSQHLQVHATKGTQQHMVSNNLPTKGTHNLKGQEAQPLCLQSIFMLLNEKRATRGSTDECLGTEAPHGGQERVCEVR